MQVLKQRVYVQEESIGPRCLHEQQMMGAKLELMQESTVGILQFVERGNTRMAVVPLILPQSSKISMP